MNTNVFSKRIHYVQMDFTDLNNYEMLDAFYKAHHLKNHIFYFAVAPRFLQLLRKVWKK